MNMVRRSLTLALLQLMLTALLFGQGIIKGTVRDSLDHQVLIGANVFLAGTALGAASDADGKFTIARIPPGQYELRVSYLGYVSKRLPVRVETDKTIEIDVNLLIDAIQTEGIVITAQMVGQVAAINRQLTSSTITNVVSGDKIMELPVANAAESVGRLPGVSIIRSGGEGSKVVIRGLSPTYNAITIAGDRIPSTDLDDRSVDLSMIAPEILAGIEVTKALTPDKDADAFGGSVDFQLATASRGGYKLNTRVQKAYNQRRNDLGDYKAMISMSDRFFEERFGLLVTGNAERTQRGSDQFIASYAVAREMRPGEEFAPITTTGVTFEHSYDVRNRYGFNVMLDYEIPGSKLQASNLLSRLDRSEIIRDRRFDFAGSNKMRYYLRERERQIDILSNSLSGEHELGSLKLDWRLSRSASQTRYPFNSRFQFQELSAFNVVGIPQFASPTDLIINAYNRPENAFLYDGEVEPEKSYERDFAAQVNTEWQYTITSDIAGKLKVGGKYRDKLRERDREFASKRLDITDPNFGRYHSQFGTPGFTYDRMAGTGYAFMRYYVDPSFDPGKFLDGGYDFGIGLSATELRYFLKNYLYDRVYRFSLQRDLDDYTVVDKLSAGYIMTELNIGSFLMILPGVRYELINIDATGKEGSVHTLEDEGFLDDDRVQDTTSVIRYSQWYPMIHVRVKPTDWFDIRLAWTKSASYPRMDYIIPSKRIKGSELKVEYGSSGLKPQLSTNYDVYLSFYGNRVGLFTVGAYYKDVQDLIYLRSGHIILDPAKEGVEPNLRGYSLQRPENNPNKTEVYGIELDWQTNFKWLPRPFDGIVLSANYAHIWSNTDFPRSFVQQERINVFPFIKTTVIDTFRTGNMPDQASDIANVSLGYDLGSFSGRISMLLQDKALSFVGVRDELDGFTDRYIRWDLSLKYGFADFFDVFCNLNNFTNQPDQSYMQTARYPTSSEYYGWTADLGVTIKF